MDDRKNRPATCPPLVDQYCAVLYDRLHWTARNTDLDIFSIPRLFIWIFSDSCSGGWQLNVTVGEQRSFSYFSSDWSFRCFRASLDVNCVWHVNLNSKLHFQERCRRCWCSPRVHLHWVYGGELWWRQLLTFSWEHRQVDLCRDVQSFCFSSTNHFWCREN